MGKYSSTQELKKGIYYNMISTILLSKNDCYIDEYGNLPSRESVPYDKELLEAFCTNQIVSEKGYRILPPSISKKVKVSTIRANSTTNTGDIIDGSDGPDGPDRVNLPITIGITISEISELSDVLVVSRSNEILKNGKKFRLDSFKLITKQGQIEIWAKK